MRYTLRQIQVFLATAQSQNISLAAQHLAMSQSAASNALKELEQQFELQLFDRVGKRLQLNETGKLIREKAQQLYDQAQALEAELQGEQGLGQLKIGATLTIGNYLAPLLMAQYMQLSPGQTGQVNLEVGNTTTIANKVLDYELDMGLIEGEFNHPKLLVKPWRPDRMVIVAHPDHPFAQTPQLSDQQLCQLQWIVRETGSGTRQAFEHAMYGLLAELDIRLELQHTEAIKRAIEANLGVACLSYIAVKDAVERGSLITLAAPHRDWRRQFYIIYQKNKTLSRSMHSWLDICLASN